MLVKSEDQGEELLQSTIVNGKLVVGGQKGGLRMWQVGVWDDNEESVMVGKGASADVLAAVPDGVGKEPMIAVGMDDGFVRFVGLGGKRAKVIWGVRHDEVEGPLGLGFDVGGRMISGGGSVVKVWEESLGMEKDVEDEETEVGSRKRANGFGTDGDESGDAEGESSEEEQPKKTRKKKKRNKGKGQSGQHAVMDFKGMD